MRTMSVLLSCILLLVSVSVFPSNWSITGGPVTFFPGDRSLPAGMYAQAGLRFEVTSQVEAEIIAIPQITPKPFSTVALGALLGLNLFDIVGPTYFNMTADVGALVAVTPDGGQYKPLVYLRVSPLVIGHPVYGYRGKILTVGMLYDITDQKVSWTFSTWIQNWFPPRQR